MIHGCLRTEKYYPISPGTSVVRSATLLKMVITLYDQINVRYVQNHSAEI